MRDNKIFRVCFEEREREERREERGGFGIVLVVCPIGDEV